MGLSILSDFKDEDLETMMDLGVKYSGEGSYAEPVSFTEHSLNDYVVGRDLCDDDVAKEYSVSNSHSTSWASALVLAAEAALRKGGYDVSLSLSYVIKCLPKYQEVGMNDVSPTDILEFVIERGLMSKETASSYDNDDDLCSADDSKYYFDVTKNDVPNMSGLMSFVAEGDPVIVLIALDFIRLKTVNDVTGNDIYTGATDQPSLYGVMRGYDEKKWTVTFNVVPCENIEMNLPVKTDNETNANYAGIAGYAMSLVVKSVPSTEPSVSTPTESPTTQAPTTQAPTTQAPTTQAPTTLAPTTQAPTTQAPTTQAPTTQAPTTQAPTTQAPTTQAPTTQAPTTQAPTTQAPTTQAPTTQAPTTQAPTTQAPTTQAPTTQAPTTQTPTTQTPTIPGMLQIQVARTCGITAPEEESFAIYEGEDVSSEPVHSMTGCEAGTQEIWIKPVLHTIVLIDSGSNGWDSGSKVELLYRIISLPFEMKEGDMLALTFNFGPAATDAPTIQAPTTQAPTTLAPGTVYVSEEEYPTLDLIPRDAQALVFRSNSYPDLTEVNLSGFTNLGSVVFEIGSFANAQSVSIESSTLTEITFGSNSFNGNSVDGSVTLYTPMLEKATFNSDSLHYVHSVHLRGLSAPIQFCVENEALRNVDTIYYMNTHSGYASSLANVMYESGHTETINIVEESEPTTEAPTTQAPTTQAPTTLAPGIVYVSEEEYPTLDLIPRDAQVLVFRSNSYPDLTEVNLSGFTNLGSVVFEIGSFANAQSVSIESSTLTEITFGSNSFNGNSVDGSVTLYTPMLEKATFNSDSLHYVHSVHLRGLSAPIQFFVYNGALSNVDTIYYMNTYSGYANALAQSMYASGRADIINIVEESATSSA